MNVRMKAAESAARPFRSDDEIEELVRGVLGTAMRRQVWLMFFDAEHRPRPLVIPYDGLGERPDDREVGRYVLLAREIAVTVGARRVVMTWERPGPAELSGAETELMARVAERFAATPDVSLRAQLLSHSVGVRLVWPPS